MIAKTLRIGIALVAMPIILFLTGYLNGLFGPITTNTGVNDLLVTIWLSNPCVQPGDTVHLRATVDNKGTTTEVVDLKGKPVLDIEISINDQKILWSDGKPLTSELTHFELAPGQSKTIEMDWVVSNDNGYHVAYAVFTYRENAPVMISRPGVPLNIGACGRG